MSAHMNVNKVILVKKLHDISYSVKDVIKCDLESSNKGFLTLLGDGRLIITSWIQKKITSLIVEEVADAWWQRGKDSDVIVILHSGALIRYSLQFDSGIICSLHLSSASVLALIREKDAGIRSTRSCPIWGHNQMHIMLQPQSDRLVVLSTNSEDTPTVLSVLRTSPLRSAHIVGDQILAQPITGSDIYIYDIRSGRLAESINLSLQKSLCQYTEWGTLCCSPSMSVFALVDGERHLYTGNISQKISLGRKGGVQRTRVILCQVVWPSVMSPGKICQISTALTDTLLAVFCSTLENDTEIQHYLTFEVSSSNLSCYHQFSEDVVLVPGMPHLLPDLFMTDAGLAMLMDEDSSVCSLDSEIDLGDILSALGEAIKEQNMSKVTEVKATIEQGLCLFLSSCNRKDGWLSQAEVRAQTFAQVATLLLASVTDLAQNAESFPFAFALQDLARHHFQNLQEEIMNAALYVDKENISQMMLQMQEQVNAIRKCDST